MIRRLREYDLDAVMRIWLDTNLHAHDFIPKEYWTGHYAMVRDLLPQAELYVYENDTTKQIEGFVGWTGNYIAGIFVTGTAQSKGIGKRLLDAVKEREAELSLSVYQKNTRAVRFYQREQFTIRSEQTEEETREKEYQMVWRK